MSKYHISTEHVGGGLMTLPATKATAWVDGSKVAESYADGHSDESKAEAIAELQDKLAERDR
jgi:hypothetical protein